MYTSIQSHPTYRFNDNNKQRTIRQLDGRVKMFGLWPRSCIFAYR